MKAKVVRDERSASERKYDELWSKLCKSARLTPMQSNLVAKYLREIMGMRIHEIESAKDMGWLLALIESEKFGTDVNRGATRLLRAQQKCVDICNEAYGHSCINANGHYEKYDGCGLAYLKNRLMSYGVEYDTNL